MKKIIFNRILVLLIMSAFCTQNSYAITATPEKAAQSTVITSEDVTDNEKEVIKKFSFKNKFHRSAEAQIKTFYKDFNKYAEKKDIEKLKNMYSDKFVNSDGFEKDTIFKMMTEAIDVYKDINYKMELEKIVADDNYAVVDIHEFEEGMTSNINDNIGDNGIISSDLYYTDYLCKEGNKWKIISSNIKSERILLKYGETKDAAIEISAPKLVTAGSEYEVNVKVDVPSEVMAVGSIVNEQIVYPQEQKKDVFKALKSGELGRVLRSNTDGNNEYATVTIGFTRATLEPPKIKFSMSGMAFAMTRINVQRKK